MSRSRAAVSVLPTSATISPLVARLQAVEAEVTASLVERGDVVRATLLALLSRQHLAIVGLPGTAKSQGVQSVAQRVVDTSGAGLRYFQYLLTRHTTPDELFGPVSVQGLRNDEYRRVITGRLPEAEIAFCDEVFKAGSSILNNLLTILNERCYDNGTQRLTAPLMTLIGASNELPDGEETAALWDRFTLRVHIPTYVSDSGFDRLLRAQPGAPTAMLSRADLIALQDTARRLPIPDEVYRALGALRRELRDADGIEASDRRWRWMLDVIRAHAVIEGRTVVDSDDLIVLQWGLWTTPEQIGKIVTKARKLANPASAHAAALADQAGQIVADWEKVRRQAGLDDVQKTVKGSEAVSKLKTLRVRLDGLVQGLAQNGKDNRRVIGYRDTVAAAAARVANVLIGGEA